MAALAGHPEADGTPEAEAPVRTGHRYRNHPLECLDYPRALALGWPSGSGMLESGHRQVLCKPDLKRLGPHGCQTTLTRAPTCASSAPMTNR